MNIINTLNNIVSQAFGQAGHDPALGVVTVSDRPELCQFQCNGSFSAAKAAKLPPFTVAEQVAEIVARDARIEKAEGVKPGFINITLTDAAILDALKEIADSEHSGVPQIGEGQTIVLDYGGPNVAKPLHIGHLRSAIIGESLKRIARLSGYTVIGDIHLGDWGLQIGLVIAELSVRNPDWRCFSDDFNPEKDTVQSLDVQLLNEIYPFASQKSKQDAEFLDRARQITLEFQQGKAGYVALWEQIMKVSRPDMKSSYDRLGVSFDLWYGESDARDYVEPMMELLQKRQLLRQSEGALVVDVSLPEDKVEIPPIIIKKSDNSNNYATTDLATILQRQCDFAPKKIWYVVDNRQSLHFTQLFRCAEKAGLVPFDCSLEHLGFGTMNGADGKPYKTRDGGVMQLSMLLDTVISTASEKIKGSQYAEDNDADEVAYKLGIAAVKFGDLINHRSKDYVFDIDKFLSSEGKTGAYLLYTVARINSILRRAGADTGGDNDISINTVYGESERALYLAVLLSGQAFAHAVNEKAPNHICENAYRLAALFSGFYHENSILNEPDEAKKSCWLQLCRLTRKMLVLHLHALGIEPVDRM